MINKLNTLTEKELLVATLFANTSTYCCGCFDDEENLSFMNARDLMEKKTGMNGQQIGGIMSSLEKKGLISDCEESYRGADINDFIGNPLMYLWFPQVAHLADEGE